MSGWNVELAQHSPQHAEKMRMSSWNILLAQHSAPHCRERRLLSCNVDLAEHSAQHAEKTGGRLIGEYFIVFCVGRDKTGSHMTGSR